MANLGTLTFGTVASSFNISITGTEPVLESIASANDGSYLYANLNSTHTGFVNMLFADMPADFKFMETLSVRLRYLAAAAQTNTWNSLSVSVIASDGTTLLAGPTTVVTGPITVTTGTNSSVVALTGVSTSASRTDWNDAVVRITWSVTRNKSGDSVEKRVTAAEFTGTYTINTSVNVGDGVTVQDEGIVLLARLVIDGAVDVVTVTESRTLVFSGEPALEIATSDLVIVQEGQETLPKINAWDDVTVVDATPLFNMHLFPVTNDLVLIEDVPIVQHTLLSMAVEAFDNVTVREGQDDDLNVRAFASDDLAVTDGGIAFHFSRLNVTGNDVVFVLDVPILSGPVGSVGINVFDPVLSEDALPLNRVRVTIYINAFSDVSVDDGSRVPEEFDVVTVQEDVTIKLARLVIEASDLVEMSDQAEASGLTVNILTSAAFDEVILLDEGTVVLHRLVSEVADDVAVSDTGEASLSSIAVIIDAFDDVSAVDVLETLQLNPLQIDVVTEVLVLDHVDLTLTILLISLGEEITVVDAVGDMQVLPMFAETFDEVSVMERVAMRVSAPGQSKPSDLTVVGAGR